MGLVMLNKVCEFTTISCLDHVAVTMYLEEKVSRLTLHMPAEWHSDDANPRFHDNSNNNIWNNPGRSANKLHKQFSAKIGEDSLKHLHSAKLMGAKFCKHDGFQARNTAVATASKYLIAFTWNDGDCPPGKGGTHDTWSKHKGRNKIHIPLGSLLETKVPGAIATGGACGKDVKIASCPSNLEVQGDGGYSSQLSLECSQSIDELPECKSPEHRGKKRSGGSLDSAGEPSTSPFKKLKLV